MFFIFVIIIGICYIVIINIILINGCGGLKLKKDKKGYELGKLLKVKLG